jgi:hypothetical protein
MSTEEPNDEVTEICDDGLSTGNPVDLLSAINHLMAPLRSKDKNIVYDFSKSPQIDPGAVLLLMYVARLMSSAARLVRYRGDSESARELTQHIQHWASGRTGAGSAVQGPSPKGLYALRDLTNQDEMVEQLNEWTKSVQQGTEASDEQVALWQMQISEVTTNAFQHGPVYMANAAISPSMVAGKADGDSVQLAALDYGSTIPRLIHDTAIMSGLPNDIDDAALIRFACNKGVTSRSVKQNQGAGLWSLTETVKRNDGTLLILSRNGLVHVCGDRIIEKHLPAIWPGQPVLEGTLTVINLHI